MNGQTHPHDPRCVQCGRSRGAPRKGAPPLPFCQLCLARRARRARELGCALAAALTRGETERAESITRSIVRLTTVN